MRLTRATRYATVRAADIACMYNGCKPVELLRVRSIPEAPRAPQAAQGWFALRKARPQIGSLTTPNSLIGLDGQNPSRATQDRGEAKNRLIYSGRASFKTAPDILSGLDTT